MGVFEAGDVVAGYTVETFLGAGGAADVYRAHPSGGHEPVALKVLHTDATNHDRARDRFVREFAIASMLKHRNIVAMYERGEVDAHPPTRPTALQPSSHASAPMTLWMAMQYVDGPNSSVLIPRGSAEPEVDAIIDGARQIASALDYAHSHDVLHRDIKPTNILLSANRQVSYLTDFGIAQLVDDAKPLARNGRVEGSIAYAAPELLQAQQLSPATDLYAFASAMMEWLTGRPPFPRATSFAITYAHIRDPIPSLTTRRHWLPNGLNAVFAKALAKDSAARYSSCTEFVDIVANFLRDIPLPQNGSDRKWWQRALR